MAFLKYWLWPNLVICEKYILILIISTKRPKIKYKKNSYLRKLLTDFRNLFFVLFLKSRRTSTNRNLTHFVHLKISYGQATNDVKNFLKVMNLMSLPNCHLRFSIVVLETLNFEWQCSQDIELNPTCVRVDTFLPSHFLFANFGLIQLVQRKWYCRMLQIADATELRTPMLTLPISSISWKSRRRFYHS